MTGYQEILTDPSFAGQMVCLTFPEQGIYGIHADLNEGTRPWATGLLCRRLTFAPDHHRSEGDLPSWLKRHHIPVMTELDTRALTQHIRDQGACHLDVPGHLERAGRIGAVPPSQGTVR